MSHIQNKVKDFVGGLEFYVLRGGIDLIKDKAPINFFLPHPHFSRSDRVGTGNSIFKMPKFRTMHVNMPAWLCFLG